MNSISLRGNNIINWDYPEIYKNPDVLIISLNHVRAANDLEIQYESERDGWVLSMRYHNNEGIEITKEVGFIYAWAVDEEEENK